jgi:HSP20 family protein
MSQIIEVPSNVFRNLFDKSDQMYYISRLLPKKDFFVKGIQKNRGKKEIFVELYIQGFRKEEIDIKLNENKIIISGEKRKESLSESHNFAIKYSSNKTFKKVLELDEEVEKVFADMVDEVLRLTIIAKLPEKTEATKIEIG